jgi:hypothetical protein
MRVSLIDPAATAIFLLLGAVSVVAGCPDVDVRGDQVPRGSIAPSFFDFGPIVAGKTCRATLQVKNDGRVDMDVATATLEGTVGQWSVERAPTVVGLGSAQDLFVDYTAAGAAGSRQRAEVVLQTDDPDEDGVLRGALTALMAAAPAGVAKTRCDDVGGSAASTSPCVGLSFGAVQVNAAGLTLVVTIENDGTADLTVGAALVDGGNAAFEVQPPRLSDTGDPTAGVEVELPVTLPPRRLAPCGEPSDADDVLIIPILYRPTALADDADTLVVTTDGLEGALLEVPLSGTGSNVGLLLDPAEVRFGAVVEDDSAERTVRVANTGTESMRVDEICVDLEGDGGCDGRCTGAAGERVLGGTLGCVIEGSAGSPGVILGGTDGQAAGADEAIVRVDWAPVAGRTTIPAGTTLSLRTNILGNRVFTAPIQGGVQGALVYAVTSDDACPDGAPDSFACVEASGDPEDSQTWTGDVAITLTNVGGATVTIASIAFEPGLDEVADDFVIGALDSEALAPGEDATFTIAYANDDFSEEDILNLLVTHDGSDSPTTIPIAMVPPTAP